MATAAGATGRLGGGNRGNAGAGEGATETLSEFDEAAVRARFALAGASEKAPTGGEGDHEDEHEEENDEELTGGPNVHEGEPDADHVVEMEAVGFEPETVEVSTGDTVAWVHTGGEPHNVVAYEGEVPDGADYWASGGFSSEEGEREGWENGQGAVRSGEYYERSFETAGTRVLLCASRGCRDGRRSHR